MKLLWHSIYILCLVLITNLVISCDQTFEPFQDNDRYSFSIFGYLDASADTQWVRIMPVRDSYFLSSETLDVTVTLEHVGSGGEIVVMNDSLFYYGQGAYAWNFWTTMNVEPEQTYLLKAEDPDGNISSVHVSLPEDFPDPYIEVDLEDQEEILVVTGVQNLADVHSNHELYHHFSDLTTVFSFNHHQDSLSLTTQQGVHTVLLNPSEAREYLETYIEQNPYTLQQREVFVASAGPEWHFFPDLSEEIISLPDGISNVENGVGYVVGIVSKRIPWEMLCFTGEIDDFGQPIANPCPF
jgi:hypothetical protein